MEIESNSISSSFNGEIERKMQNYPRRSHKFSSTTRTEASKTRSQILSIWINEELKKKQTFCCSSTTFFLDLFRCKTTFKKKQ